MAFKKIKSLTFDAKLPKNKFAASRAAETAFNRALKQVARAAGSIVNVHIDGVNIDNEKRMMDALEAYSELIGPWAMRQSMKLISASAAKNKKAYEKNSKAMGEALRLGVAESNVNQVATKLMNEQVGLIKSIPIEAGLRAQRLASEAFFNGSRSDEIARELQRTTGVTEARATLIARTETARANSSLNQARAVSVGSERYIWRNSGDGAVRPAHEKLHGRKLDGQIFSWDKPPTLDDGTTGHPGTFPNCRCFAEAIFDDGE